MFPEAAMGWSLSAQQEGLEQSAHSPSVALGRLQAHCIFPGDLGGGKYLTDGENVSL